MVDHGANLLPALKEALRLGCEVRPKRRSGECLVRPPHKDLKPVVLNRRKKDAPRILTKLIGRLRALLGEEAKS
jgi:hypothetical protein